MKVFKHSIAKHLVKDFKEDFCSIELDYKIFHEIEKEDTKSRVRRVDHQTSQFLQTQSRTQWTRSS